MTKKHLHKYRRVRQGKDKKYIIFKCIEPQCSHFIRKDMIEGKLSSCNSCDSPFIIDKYAMLLAKPKCVSCRTRKDKTKQVMIDKLTQLMEQL